MKKFWKSIIILVTTLFLGYITWCALSPAKHLVTHNTTLPYPDLEMADTLSSISSWLLWDPILKIRTRGKDIEIASDSMVSWYNGPEKYFVKLRTTKDESVEAYFSIGLDKISTVKYTWRRKGEEILLTTAADLHITSFWERPFAEIRIQQMANYLEVQSTSLKAHLKE